MAKANRENDTDHSRRWLRWFLLFVVLAAAAASRFGISRQLDRIEQAVTATRPVETGQ